MNLCSTKEVQHENCGTFMHDFCSTIEGTDVRPLKKCFSFLCLVLFNATTNISVFHSVIVFAKKYSNNKQMGKLLNYSLRFVVVPNDPWVSKYLKDPQICPK